MTMEEAKILKDALIKVGINATIDGRSKTICLPGSRYGIGGFVGTVAEALAVTGKAAAANSSAAAFNSAQPQTYNIGCEVNGSAQPNAGTVRALVPGDEIKWVAIDNGGSRQFCRGTITKAGVTARAKFGRTTSGKARTRWFLTTPSGNISTYC